MEIEVFKVMDYTILTTLFHLFAISFPVFIPKKYLNEISIVSLEYNKEISKIYLYILFCFY